MSTMTTAHQVAPKASTGSVYHVDSSRSRAEFKVGKRFLFVLPLTVTGTVDRIAGTIVLDARAPEHARADVTFAVASLTTGKAKRDAHLQSADFFDTERFPEIAFASRRIEAVDPAAGHFRVTGDLTIRDITLSETLDVHLLVGLGGPRVHATVTLDRRHYGLLWQHPLVVPGDSVQVTIELETLPGV